MLYGHCERANATNPVVMPGRTMSKYPYPSPAGKLEMRPASTEHRNAVIESEGKKCLRLWFTVLLDCAGDIHNWLHVYRDNKDVTMSGWRQQAHDRYCSALAWTVNMGEQPAGFVWVCRLFEVSPRVFRDKMITKEFYGQMRKLLPFVDRR